MSPMSQRIIIDGYNVIYTDDRLRRKACKDLEGARAELLEMLKGYVRHRRLQVTVVFDGRGGVVDRPMSGVLGEPDIVLNVC